jgi:hypothetical protein
MSIHSEVIAVKSPPHRICHITGVVSAVSSGHVLTVNSEATGLLSKHNSWKIIRKCKQSRQSKRGRWLPGDDSWLGHSFQVSDKEVLNKVQTNFLVSDKEVLNKVQTNFQVSDKEILNKVQTNFQASDKEIIKKVQTNLIYSTNVLTVTLWNRHHCVYSYISREKLVINFCWVLIILTLDQKKSVFKGVVQLSVFQRVL